MVLNTKTFFILIRTHYKMSPAARHLDILGRLSLMAAGKLRADELTRRCLQRFIERRLT